MQFLTYTLPLLLSTLPLTLADSSSSSSSSVSTTKTAAPVITDNAKRATFQAILQADKPIQGTITGVSNDNGTGTNFYINFFNFPPVDVGPFKYHIHQNPVPSNGDCNATGAHLDPYNFTETPACVTSTPQLCQLGDLAGKHGEISDTDKTPNFQTQYLDLYLSTSNNSLAFFGNRSIVVHAGNGTRLNCGNFMMQDGSGSNGTNGGNASHTGGSNGNSSAIGSGNGGSGPETGGAVTAKAMQFGGAVALVVGVVGGVWLL